MFGVVEDVDLSAHSLCGNQELIEGAVSGPVNFTLVVDLLHNLWGQPDKRIDVQTLSCSVMCWDLSASFIRTGKVALDSHW